MPSLIQINSIKYLPVLDYLKIINTWAWLNSPIRRLPSWLSPSVSDMMSWRCRSGCICRGGFLQSRLWIYVLSMLIRCCGLCIWRGRMVDRFSRLQCWFSSWICRHLKWLQWLSFLKSIKPCSTIHSVCIFSWNYTLFRSWIRPMAWILLTTTLSQNSMNSVSILNNYCTQNKDLTNKIQKDLSNSQIQNQNLS